MSYQFEINDAKARVKKLGKEACATGEHDWLNACSAWLHIYQVCSRCDATRELSDIEVKSQGIVGNNEKRSPHESPNKSRV